MLRAMRSRLSPSAHSVRVSVIIPTYKRSDLLQRVLSSIARQSLAPQDYEVLVVDDGSDPPLALAEEPTLPFRLVVLQQHHQGASVARNLGAGHSRGDVLVFLDDDICISGRTLEVMAERCQPGTDIIVLGTLIVPEGAKPSVFARVMTAQAGEEASRWEGREVPFTRCRAGLLGIRREAFATLGGFQDPGGGWPNWDDVDFGYRAFQGGFRFLEIDEVIGEHWDYALADLSTACERWQRACRSAVHLFRKHPAIQSQLPMFDDKTPLSRHDSLPLLLRKLARRAMSQAVVLGVLERTAALLEHRYPSSLLLPPLYRWIIGCHIFIGFRKGLGDALRSESPTQHQPGRNRQD
jgi:hypothetical protein